MKLSSRRLLKAIALLKGFTMAEVAKNIGISEPSLYRKLNGASDFTRMEIIKIKNLLCLDTNEMIEIFFNEERKQVE